MGGAYTSQATGVLAIYWNQAGLAFTPDQGEASVTKTLPDGHTVNYDSFTGVAVKLNDRLGLGFGQTRLLPMYGGETWNTLGAGYRVNDHLAFGGAFRAISGVNPNTSVPYSNSGFDLSAQYRTGPLNLGLLIQDVGGPNETNPWTQNIRPAISLQTDKVTLAYDLYDAELLKDSLQGYEPALSSRTGLEYRPWGQHGPLALRGGLYQWYDDWGQLHNTLMYGAGAQWANVFGDLVLIPQWDAFQVTTGIRF